MKRLLGTPWHGRQVAKVCLAVLLLAVVAAEGADTRSLLPALAWVVSGGLALAALGVPRKHFDAVAVAALATSALVTLLTSRLTIRPEHTFGIIESCALLLLITRALRLRPLLRATALAGGALLALTVMFLRLPAYEYHRMSELAVPAIWCAAALMTALGLYLRLLDRYRDRERDAGTQAQRLEYARELHDFVGHHVTAIIAQTRAVRFTSAAGRPPSPEDLDSMLAAIEEAGSQAMQSMRSMVTVLRDPGASASDGTGTTLADLRTLTTGFSRTGTGTTLALDPRLAVGELPPGVATTVHHIVREALTNVRKHAQAATRVTVDVRLAGGTAAPSVRVSVVDDGPAGSGGPGPRSASARSFGQRPRYGLVGLSERVTMVGGTLTAGPRADAGWIVEADIPLPAPLALDTDDRSTATLDA
ncbi:sensor histidine kinase [Streptomyces cellulosae]|uniref:sensor histidine kinase n=1 Tax=Streptomyces cellulosae TaxID=1968 RepID=UPI00068CF3C8|nr:histidine kinase [Streptomyces cellulosae]